MKARLPVTEPVAGDDPDIQRLAGQYDLTVEVAEQICALMDTTGMSFAEAGLKLGVIRPDLVPDEVLVTRRDAAARPRSEGLIERASERLSTDRQVVLRQGEEVTPGHQLQIAFDSMNPRNERMRALRTELLLLSEATRHANVFAILSPDVGEGRSQLCAELAISFGQLGRRTLLVDGDMRNPRQHIMFASTNEFGLSHAISQNTRPYVHPVKGLARMFLLTAGLCPPNPLELLSDGRFDKVLTDWRSTYEFVIIDTPPVSRYADGFAIATLAGRVIVASRAKHTSFKHTREMMRRLATTRAQVLGGVISHF